MANKKIQEYIAKGLEQGYKEKNLMKNLADKGWKSKDIKSAIDEVKKMRMKKQKIELKHNRIVVTSNQKEKNHVEKNTPDDSKKEKEKSEKKGRFHFFGFGKKKEKQSKESNQDKPKKDKEDNAQKEKNGKFDKNVKKDKNDKKEKNDKSDKKNKEGKHGKHKKPKPEPIVYKKPVGKITTEVDDMLVIISESKMIRIDVLAKKLKVKESEVMEWIETLESWNLIKINYPLFGKPIIKMASKKNKGDESNEGKVL